MADKILTTPAGLEKVKAELKHLKSVEKPKNILDIETARAHGDLSENAEYSAAKERQSHIQGRILELENLVACAQVIEPSALEHEKIYFGATVTLENTSTGENQTYQIVGTHESEVNLGRISVESPLAKKLIGKEEGDRIVLPRSGQNVEFEVLKIKYI